MRIFSAVTVILIMTSVSVRAGVPFSWLLKQNVQEETLSEDVTPKRGKRAQEREDKEEARATMQSKETTAYNWYCMHKKNGERPPLPPEMQFIGQYDGYYIGEDDKVIYLTFDAGYENGNIAKILDILKEEEVQGAFFILENLIKQNTDLVKRMVEDGHTVCNHTAKHRDMTTVSSMDEFSAELEKMQSVYREYTGQELSKYYRPPEGKFNEQNMAWAKELGYKTIFWSFAYADWDNNQQMNTEKAKNKILESTHNGEILLLHPTSATNAQILGELIRAWKEMGYRFGSLDELTGSGMGA